MVEFVESEELRSVTELTEAFALRADRPAVWLQRICLSILKRLGAFYQKDTVTVRRHVLDAKSFMERLYRQKDELFKLLGREPTALLIGSSDYQELMGDDEFNRAFAFRAEYAVRNRILDLEVRVIPWMRGILVMP